MSGSGVRVLQRDPAATVVLEADGVTVRKTFHGEDPGRLRELARREFQRMAQFSAALDDVDSAACPKALELDLGAEPSITMERAAGVRMQSYLARKLLTPELFERVARTLQLALVRYVEAFREPYWDFIFRNMFYDAERDLVTFIDYGIPAIYLPAMGCFASKSPMDVSLGSLVASSIFEAARPTRMARLREHRQARILASVVVRQCLAALPGPPVSADGIGEVAGAAYKLARGGGGRTRRWWYGSCGEALARPAANLRALCGTEKASG
jgi:hypothetical protein